MYGSEETAVEEVDVQDVHLSAIEERKVEDDEKMMEVNQGDDAAGSNEAFILMKYNSTIPVTASVYYGVKFRAFQRLYGTMKEEEGKGARRRRRKSKKEKKAEQIRIEGDIELKGLDDHLLHIFRPEEFESCVRTDTYVFLVPF